MFKYQDIDYELVAMPEYQFYRRIPNSTSLKASDMPIQFIKTLTDITGDFDLSNYTPYIPDEIICDEKERCICSNIITKPYYIYHAKTNTIIQVGSECINKLNKSLAKGLKNGICKICKIGLSDMRKKWCKEGYCSLNCQTICKCGRRKGWSSVIKSYYPLCFRCYQK